MVNPSDLNNFPNNCIGSLIAANNAKQLKNFGSGFLISPTVVLTAAHTFQAERYGSVMQLKPDCFTIIESGSIKNQIKVKDYRINPEFIQLRKQILAYLI